MVPVGTCKNRITRSEEKEALLKRGIVRNIGSFFVAIF
jgi:hypothetical protein